MTLSPTFLFYRSGFAATNGTSVQVERLFRDTGDRVAHILWDTKMSGAKSLPWVIDTEVKMIKLKPPFTRFSRNYQRAKHLFFPSWWRQGRLNTARLNRALAGVPIHPRQAYITFYGEEDAGKCHSLWKAVGRPPFVLHIMDVLVKELSERKTPNYFRMVREAHHVLCLNKLIQGEMEKIGARATSLFPLCSDLEPRPRPTPPGPLKIIISGALYAALLVENPAMALLVEAWPKVLEAFPGAELHYAGAESRGLPAQLRPWVRDHGLLDPKTDYRRLLDTCHAAYVPVSHPSGSLLRYSMPSRIPDYLILGLPVIACAANDTGIHEFLESTPRASTRLVEKGDEFLAALQHFAGDAQRWEKASGAAIAYSRQAFAVEPARELLFRRLNEAGKSARAGG